MSFVSRNQEKWAFANNKPWAKEWASKTSQKSLPEKVNNNKMDKKKIIKKAVRAHCGKGGIGDIVKGVGKGAIEGARNLWKQGVKETGKYDPTNLVKGALGGIAGGIVGGVKASKSPLSVPKLSPAAKTKLPSISQGAFPKMPSPRTAEPLKNRVKSMPINAPKSMPAKDSIVKKLKRKIA